MLLLENLIALAVEASPWLLLGLLIAGLMKSWLPSQILSKHLGSGKMAVVKAAVFGAPLPLCSCGVIPVATELRRSGASAPATSSFLVATPETGVDSISVSYALLGPVFAIYRPFAAIFSAIATGLIVSTTDDTLSKKAVASKSCCTSQKKITESNCCATKPAPPSAWAKTITGIKYAFSTLIDDLVKWLLVGLLFATLVRTFVPTSFLTSYGSGLIAMLVMIAISIPMYICATASTPIAAGFILAGLSPGTALVFMMAGPATNISTLGVIKNEMGKAVLIRYLLGISSCAILFGYGLDWGVSVFDIDIGKQMAHSHEIVPLWVGYTCAIALVILSFKPLRKKIF
ncbi:SO_0444 family Cu/Zn efflux transporter [Thalassotalea atypica]|uniref:SO_0444 family Cu/Zn efflux transporter n=1 Tax=Thalassotalea atypica TaxID=2054316 RepID=UPI0025722AC7|nr:SO_0444 family Cu/Zn efflux transporter [Thalassotalea atypica]